MSVCLPVCLPACLSVCLCFCLPVCLRLCVCMRKTEALLLTPSPLSSISRSVFLFPHPFPPLCPGYGTRAANPSRRDQQARLPRGRDLGLQSHPQTLSRPPQRLTHRRGQPRPQRLVLHLGKYKRCGARHTCPNDSHKPRHQVQTGSAPLPSVVVLVGCQFSTQRPPVKTPSIRECCGTTVCRRGGPRERVWWRGKELGRRL